MPPRLPLPRWGESLVETADVLLDDDDPTVRACEGLLEQCRLGLDGDGIRLLDELLPFLDAGEVEFVRARRLAPKHEQSGGGEISDGAQRRTHVLELGIAVMGHPGRPPVGSETHLDLHRPGAGLHVDQQTRGT